MPPTSRRRGSVEMLIVLDLCARSDEMLSAARPTRSWPARHCRLPLCAWD